MRSWYTFAMKERNTTVSILALVSLVVGVIYLSNRPSNTNLEALITPNEPRLEHVHGLAVDVANSERLLLATHHGLLQLTDGKLSQVGTVADDLMGFSPHPSDANIYYSSGHSARGGNLGFQKSADGGVTWTKISDGLKGPVDFHSMTVSTANPDIVYGHFSTLQRSMDGGQTWESAEGIIQPFMLTTHSQKENVVFAATQAGVMVSEDYGDTWSDLSSQLSSGAVSTFALGPNGTDALVFSQALEGLGKSTDGGITWKKIEGNFGGSALSFIAYDQKSSSNVYAISQENSIYKSTDGGETWSKVR